MATYGALEWSMTSWRKKCWTVAERLYSTGMSFDLIIDAQCSSSLCDGFAREEMKKYINDMMYPSRQYEFFPTLSSHS